MNSIRTKSKSPQFGTNRLNQSKSKSPEMPKMGEYKRNQLILHLKKMKQLSTKQAPPEKTQRELTQTELIQQEIREFKKEIEKKFLLSTHNNQFRFPYTTDIDSDDDSLQDLKDMTTCYLNNQPMSPPKVNLVKATFESTRLDHMIEQYKNQREEKNENIVHSQTQSKLKTQPKQEVSTSYKRVRTEGDDVDIRNTLKTAKKYNYFQQNQQNKATAVLETIRQKNQIIKSNTNKTLNKSQSPTLKPKTPEATHIRQKSPLLSRTPQPNLGRSFLKEETPNRKAVKQNSRVNSSKSNNSQIWKPLELNKGIHNYYNSNNNSKMANYSSINKNSNSFRQKYLISQPKSQSHRAAINTTRSKNASRSKRINLSSDSHHSDSSYKQKLAAHQERLKELLLQSKPFYL